MIQDVISMIMPVFGRYDLTRRALASAIDTTREHAAHGRMEYVVIVDANDRQHVENLAPLLAEVTKAGARAQLAVMPRRVGALHGWNAGAARSVGEYLVLAASDNEWLPGWLDAALAKRDELAGGSGYGVVGLNDGHRDGKVDFVNHWLVSRKFLVDKLGGVLCMPCYYHFCVDMEVCARARAADAFVWAEDARLVHYHPVWKSRPADASDLALEPHFRADMELFYRRRAAGFPNTWEPVISADSLTVAEAVTA